MRTIDIINILAIVLSPVVAVLVGQYIQGKDKKRNDKMEVFKTLMYSRGLGWSFESVKALNVIEVVFGDDKKVLNQWKAYYDKLCVENPNDTEQLRIKTEGDKLLDVMAKSLGYGDEVTWETIQNPYIPRWLWDSMNQQQRYQNVQMDVMNFASTYVQQMMNGTAVKDDSTSDNKK